MIVCTTAESQLNILQQKFINSLGRVISDADDDGTEIGFGVEAAQPGGLDDGIDGGGASEQTELAILLPSSTGDVLPVGGRGRAADRHLGDGRGHGLGWRHSRNGGCRRILPGGSPLAGKLGSGSMTMGAGWARRRIRAVTGSSATMRRVAVLVGAASIVWAAIRALIRSASSATVSVPGSGVVWERPIFSRSRKSVSSLR